MTPRSLRSKIKIKNYPQGLAKDNAYIGFSGDLGDGLNQFKRHSVDISIEYYDQKVKDDILTLMQNFCRTMT
ncbi:Uncharacterised protein [Chlamydia trachomatis]|nr:Uncharacterised protein [Chlamydia trachomatis]